MTIRVLAAEPLALCRETVAHRMCCGTDDHAASVTRTEQAVPPSGSRPIGTGSHVAAKTTYSGMPAMTPGPGQHMMAARRMSDLS
jgi:hypothetical protein